LKKKAATETEKLKKHVKELEDTLKRVQADYENFKKQEEKRREAFSKYSCSMVLEKLLPFLDSFDSAVKNHKDDHGLNSLHEQLTKILVDEGLIPMESIGKPFDPYRQEVMLSESDPKLADDIVIEEIQKGYILHDKVLRPAKVKVNKNDNKGDSKERDSEDSKSV